MDTLHEEGKETNDEITPAPTRSSRRQRQQLRFAEEEPTEPKSPSNFKPPTRASRFLSISEPSLGVPGANFLRLQQLHKQAVNEEGITDSMLDKLPFK